MRETPLSRGEVAGGASRSLHGDVAITLDGEEEFLLVDSESRDLLADSDLRIFEACARRRG